MVRDIAEGYYLLTERSFRPFSRSELDKIQFEIDRKLRELRGEQPALDDLPAVQSRNRRIQRLTTGTMMLSSYKVRMRL